MIDMNRYDRCFLFSIEIYRHQTNVDEHDIEAEYLQLYRFI